MNLDIRTAVITTIIVAIAGALLVLLRGVNTLRHARRVSYFRIRRSQRNQGRGLLAFSMLLLAIAFGVGVFGEPLAYTYFPPSPTASLTATITLTPTISQTPTISLTPTITPTPQFSYTPTTTGTPFLPESISGLFTARVTPNPQAVFSPLQFAAAIENYLPVNPRTSYENPVGRIFACFSYDLMSDGVQWTAVWFRRGEVVYFETGPWEGGTGGYGYSEWWPPAEDWQPGTYQVVVYVGQEWKVLGEFRVLGEPPTPTNTPTPTITPSPSNTLIPSWTPRPTDTRWPSPTASR